MYLGAANVLNFCHYFGAKGLSSISNIGDICLNAVIGWMLFEMWKKIVVAHGAYNLYEHSVFLVFVLAISSIEVCLADVVYGGEFYSPLASLLSGALFHLLILRILSYFALQRTMVGEINHGV